MTLIEKKGARFGLALLGAAALLAPAGAGAVQPAYGAASEQPGDALSRNLKLIAESPHNVGALVGAGRATLDLGDAQAALSFFARAEQDAPRDGWVKKWMGSALVQLEQPAAALKFFRDAVSLGVPDASVAGDRGLAWDISGDPRRAQRDYRLALARAEDPEITRRLALSLAISGEREPALQAIQEQVMRRDPAGLRTRALVLALSGDRAGADRAVEAAMPGAQAVALEPFLARLPSLSLADRALAVHLGHFPGTGGPGTAPAYAQNGYGGGLPAGYTPTPSHSAPPPAAPHQDRYALLDAGRPDESRPGFGRPAAAADPAAAEPRRIPGATAASPARSRPQTEAMPQWSWSRGEMSAPRRSSNQTTARPAPTQLASSRPAPFQAAQHPTPKPAGIADPAPTNDDAQRDDNAASTASESRPVEIVQAQPEYAAPPVQAPPPHRAAPPTLPPPTHAGTRSRLAEVAAELDRIEQQRTREAAAGVPPAGTRMSGSRSRTRSEQLAREEAAGVPPAGTRMSTAHAAARTAAPATKPKKAPPAPREPARHWVQIAHAGDPDALPQVFARLKEKAPKLFAGRTLWTATGRSTNRLLVGPFASDDAAQAYVDRLEKAEVNGLAWTSEAGEKIEKFGGR